MRTAQTREATQATVRVDERVFEAVAALAQTTRRPPRVREGLPAPDRAGRRTPCAWPGARSLLGPGSDRPQIPAVRPDGLTQEAIPHR